jgi:aryl-alcohol dehydrogenase-like predicted oxidoreductase
MEPPMNPANSAVSTVRLGRTGPQVYPIALGCMGMSGMYGPADEAESIATIHEALDLGINVLDTGDFYGQGHNEMLIGRAIADRRSRALLSVKFGALRGPDGSWGGMDTRPAAIKNFLAYSLTRLGVEHIDIYRPARLDPAVPIEDTIGAIADLKKAGYVRFIGLSEVGPETLRRAQAVHPIVDLQIEYSLVSRGPEDKIVPTLRELGIAMTAYGVLSRGLLAGSRPTAAGDFRSYLPRFAGDNGAKNQRLVDSLAKVAHERGVTPVALAIAWVMSKGKDIIPVIGARTRKQLKEIPVALGMRLTIDELNVIEAAVPVSAVAGTRYQQEQMKHLDSELGPLKPA